MNLLRVVATLLALGAVQNVPSGTITGTVRTPGGAPAAAARVAAMTVPGDGQALSEGSALVSIAQTDRSGRYRLEDIPPGRYFIVAGPIARLTFHPGTTEQRAATIVTIGRDGTTRTGLDFALDAVSTLTSGIVCCSFAGQIVTEDGSPLPNVVTFSLNIDKSTCLG